MYVVQRSDSTSQDKDHLSASPEGILTIFIYIDIKIEREGMCMHVYVLPNSLF